MKNVRIPVPFYGDVVLMKKGEDGYSRINDSGEKKNLTVSQPAVSEPKKPSKIKSLFHSLPSVPSFGKKKDTQDSDSQQNPSYQNRT